MYRLGIGKDEDTIIERARQMNGPLPASVANAPELLPGLGLYFEIFRVLSKTRQISMSGVGSIPYPALASYLDDNDFHGWEREKAMELVIRMDEAFTVEIDRQRSKSAPKPGAGNGS